MVVDEDILITVVVMIDNAHAKGAKPIGPGMMPLHSGAISDILEYQ
jgi:hypothetical protein